MLHGVPRYYHDSQTAYGGSKILVKQERVDLMDTHGIVDVGILSHEHQLNLSHQNLTDRISGSFHGSYFDFHQKRNTQHEMESGIPERGTKIPNPSMDNYSAHISTSPATQDFDTNSMDITSVPSTLITTGMSHYLDIDLSLNASQHRARREFVPDNKKDNSYWCKRLKNNDSARRSRVKRKALEKIMEVKLMELEKENIELRHEVAALRRRYCEVNLPGSVSSYRDLASSSSTSLLSLSQASTETKVEKPHIPCELHSNCESHVYIADSLITSNHNLVSFVRARNDLVECADSNLVSKSTGNESSNLQQCSSSFQDGSIDTLPHPNVTGALDLTTEHSDRSTPASELSSSGSFSSDSNCSLKRYSFIGSESSSLEENSNNHSIKVFPLKCRWKKEMHATYMGVP